MCIFWLQQSQQCKKPDEVSPHSLPFSFHFLSRYWTNMKLDNNLTLFEAPFEVEKERIGAQILLGKGGYGEVLQIDVPAAANASVAVKYIRQNANRFKSEKVACEMVREKQEERWRPNGDGAVEKACSQRCDRLVRIYCVQEEIDQLRIAMEVMDGTLEAFRGKCEGKCDWLQVCVELLEGLDYLHGLQIIHGDVNPRNVLYRLSDAGADCKHDRPQPCVKLADFGACLRLGVDERFKFETVAYAAPELKSFEAPTVKADVFSFGVLVDFLITGLLPGEKRKDEIMGGEFDNLKEASDRNFQLNELCVRGVHYLVQKRASVSDLLEVARRLRGGETVQSFVRYTPVQTASVTIGNVLVANVTVVSLESMRKMVQRCAEQRLPLFARHSLDDSKVPSLSDAFVNRALYDERDEQLQLSKLWERRTEKRQSRPGSRARLVLVEAEAGCGKSTLLQYIANQQASAIGWHDVKLVMHFSLPHLREAIRGQVVSRQGAPDAHVVMSVILSALYGVTNDNNRERLVKMLIDNAADIVWLVDGLDEVDVDDSYFFRFVKTLFFQSDQHELHTYFARVIVTSRRERGRAMQSLRDGTLCLSLPRFDARGKEVNMYVRNYPFDADGHSEKAWELCQKTGMIDLMCLPLLANLVCYTIAHTLEATSDVGGDGHDLDVLVNRTSVLSECYKAMLQRSHNRSAKSDKALRCVWEPILEYFAWQSYVNRNDVMAVNAEYVYNAMLVLSMEQVTDSLAAEYANSIVKSGLLVEVLWKSNDAYSFHHALLRDFAAAKYVERSLLDGDATKKQRTTDVLVGLLDDAERLNTHTEFFSILMEVLAIRWSTPRGDPKSRLERFFSVMVRKCTSVWATMVSESSNLKTICLMGDLESSKHDDGGAICTVMQACMSPLSKGCTNVLDTLGEWLTNPKEVWIPFAIRSSQSDSQDVDEVYGEHARIWYWLAFAVARGGRRALDVWAETYLSSREARTVALSFALYLCDNISVMRKVFNWIYEEDRADSLDWQHVLIRWLEWACLDDTPVDVQSFFMEVCERCSSDDLKHVLSDNVLSSKSLMHACEYDGSELVKLFCAKVDDETLEQILFKETDRRGLTAWHYAIAPTCIVGKASLTIDVLLERFDRRRVAEKIVSDETSRFSPLRFCVQSEEMEMIWLALDLVLEALRQDEAGRHLLATALTSELMCELCDCLSNEVQEQARFSDFLKRLFGVIGKDSFTKLWKGEAVVVSREASGEEEEDDELRDAEAITSTSTSEVDECSEDDDDDSDEDDGTDDELRDAEAITSTSASDVDDCSEEDDDDSDDGNGTDDSSDTGYCVRPLSYLNGHVTRTLFDTLRELLGKEVLFNLVKLACGEDNDDTIYNFYTVNDDESWCMWEAFDRSEMEELVLGTDVENRIYVSIGNMVCSDPHPKELETFLGHVGKYLGNDSLLTLLGRVENEDVPVVARFFEALQEESMENCRKLFGLIKKLLGNEKYVEFEEAVMKPKLVREGKKKMQILRERRERDEKDGKESVDELIAKSLEDVRKCFGDKFVAWLEGEESGDTVDTNEKDDEIRSPPLKRRKRNVSK